MRTRRPAFWICIILLTALNGCSDKTAPELQPYMTGVVTDAAGMPIEGASVTLSFGIDGIELPGWEDPAKRIKTQVKFFLPEPGSVKMWVEDYLRREVIVLVDEDLEPGAHAVAWDGTDDAGKPVPPGLYFVFVHLWQDGPDAPPTALERELLLYDYEPEALLHRPHAVTDEHGRFEVPLALLPVGEEIRVTDENGNNLGLEPISNRVHVFAIVEDGPGVRYVDRYVTVENRTDPVRVDLQLP